MRLLTIDPGLDFVAGAYMRPELCPLELPGDAAREALRALMPLRLPELNAPRDFLRAAFSFERELRISTPATWATVLRCRRIADELAGEEHFADVGIVEVPRYDGRNHARMGKSEKELARDTSKLYRSIGAVAAGIRTGVLLEHKAFTSKKEDRRDALNIALQLAGKRPIRNLDVADAAYIGCIWTAAYLSQPDVFTRHAVAGTLYHSFPEAQLAQLKNAAAEPSSPRKRASLGRGRA